MVLSECVSQQEAAGHLRMSKNNFTNTGLGCNVKNSAKLLFIRVPRTE